MAIITVATKEDYEKCSSDMETTFTAICILLIAELVITIPMIKRGESQPSTFKKVINCVQLCLGM
jgi:hypothetical protein